DGTNLVYEDAYSESGNKTGLTRPDGTKITYRYSFFFFQAEDGIRDRNVTGVQTCALPISSARSPASCCVRSGPTSRATSPRSDRSEERRVGKECRSRWATYRLKKK